MSTEKVLLLDFSELHAVVVECRKCGTSVTFDVQREKVPESCPCCKDGAYDPIFCNQLSQFQDLYKILSSDIVPKVKIAVRVEG